MAPFRRLSDADSIAAYYMRTMEIASIVLLAHRANAGNRGGVVGICKVLGYAHRRHRPEARQAEDPRLDQETHRYRQLQMFSDSMIVELAIVDRVETLAIALFSRLLST